MSTRITKHIQELVQATDAARISEEMLHYLEMCAGYHRYSHQNVCLILIAFPNATMVAGFKVVYVFDVSQTDGDPLPEPPNWKSLEQNEMLNKRLIQFAESKGIVVET